MEANISDKFIRSQLQERRRSLSTAIEHSGRAERLVRLLQEVDSALERMTAGTYGLARLIRSVAQHKTSSPQDLIRACLDDVKAFRGKMPNLDDLTIMTIKRIA